MKRVVASLALAAGLVGCGASVTPRSTPDVVRVDASADVQEDSATPPDDFSEVTDTGVEEDAGVEDSGSGCGEVPVEGRCTSATAYESCNVPSEGAPTVDVTSCGAGEACRLETMGARCVLVAECRDEATECSDTSTLRTCRAGRWSPTECTDGCLSAPGGASCAMGVPTRVLTGRVLYEARAVNTGYTNWQSTVIPRTPRGF